MTKEYWYFLAGMLAVLLPLIAVIAVKKLQLFETRPDKTLAYKQVDGQSLSLHAFLAHNAGATKNKPALLLFHGGRWLYGHPRAFYPQCTFFAAQGYHCFSAQYRLGANNRVDVRKLVADANDALAYLATNAAGLNIDPARLYVGGGSAGGHLAAALGTRVAGVSAPAPAAMVLFNPMLDLGPGTPDHHLVASYWRSVSPQHHIKPGIPPTLVLLGSDDPEVPVATVETFCAGIKQAGGTCEVEIYAGQSHGFFNNPPYLEKTNRRALAFLQALQR